MAEEMAQIEKEEEAKMQKELIKLEEELKQETADERNRGKKSLEILNRRKLKLLQVRVLTKYLKYPIVFVNTRVNMNSKRKTWSKVTLKEPHLLEQVSKNNNALLTRFNFNCSFLFCKVFSCACLFNFSSYTFIHPYR